MLLLAYEHIYFQQKLMNLKSYIFIKGGGSNFGGGSGLGGGAGGIKGGYGTGGK